MAIAGAMLIGTQHTAQAVPIFVNGDFESSVGTTLTGWTVLGGSQEGNARYGGAFGVAGQGTKWCWLGNFESPGSSIAQTLGGFTVGASYTLNFLQSSETSTASDQSTITIAGVGTLSNTFTTPPSFNSSVGGGFWNNWQAESWTFTASAASLTFLIDGPHTTFDTGLDGFQITQNSSSVPDGGSTLALLGLALGGLAAVRRKLGVA